MYNYIITGELGGISAEIDSLVYWEKRCRQTLTDDQRDELGLGLRKVILCPDDEYVVYRDKDAVYVWVAAEGQGAKDYRLRLELQEGPDGEASNRWKVSIADIKKVPGLYQRLRRTSIFASLGEGTRTVYLYRMVHALWNGDDIYYDEDAKGKQIHIGHLDQIACNDLYSNLFRVTKQNHLIYDTKKTEEKEQAIIQDLFSGSSEEELEWAAQQDEKHYWLFKEVELEYGVSVFG